jgi:predicted nucleic acid-binding protein
MAADPVFLDTNVLVAATVGAHPSHSAATSLIERLGVEGTPLCVSPQVLREFLVVLTRQPVHGREVTVDEALESWRAGCAVLDEDEIVVAELVALVRQRRVKGKQVHDANIVAVMRANGVGRLATLDVGDFQEYEDDVRLEVPVA